MNEEIVHSKGALRGLFLELLDGFPGLAHLGPQCQHWGRLFGNHIFLGIQLLQLTFYIGVSISRHG